MLIVEVPLKRDDIPLIGQQRIAREPARNAQVIPKPFDQRVQRKRIDSLWRVVRCITAHQKRPRWKDRRT
jgi:hypothetical protein